MGALVAVLVVVVGLALVGGVVWFVLNKMKGQEYRGTVTAKDTNQGIGKEGDTYSRYVLVVRSDDGTETKVTVGEKVWEQFSVGDRIVKEAGQYNPTKV